ncbi:MAG: pyridoxamine 5'-phosphate oxidase family protein [Chitinophagaceae bacterium]
MDSINKQQKEDNYKDLHGNEAARKIKELTEKAGNCFFCTNTQATESFATRPMSVRQINDDGIFWFLSSVDSNKNAEIKSNNKVRLLLQGSTYSDFLSIEGTATISQDKEMIKELWEPILKTWFTDGIDDPRITVIRVTPDDGYYWDNKHGQLIAFAKQMAGAIMGKTTDDSIEGKLKL